MSESSSSVDEVVSATRALLRFQGDLGLRGLDLPEGMLQTRALEVPVVEGESSMLGVEVDRTAPAVGVPKPSDPRAALQEIRERLGECTRCKLAKGRTNIVFGVGNASARLLFAGEGPGRDEDLQGEPFVGEAGSLLDRMIRAMGFSRNDVYIANIVKCRPPRNRDPERDEIQACEPFLQEQIRTIGPEVIVALGRYAAQTLLRDSTSISRMRGNWREYVGIPLMPTFHPAYLLRSPEQKRPVWQDLQEVMRKLGVPNPHASR